MEKPFTQVLGLPALLKKQGYTTIHCGKAHFGSKNTPGANPRLFGFDYNIAGTEIGGPADYRGSRKYGTGNFHVRGLDENNYYENDTFLTEALTQEALKRLDAIRKTPGRRTSLSTCTCPTTPSMPPSTCAVMTRGLRKSTPTPMTVTNGPTTKNAIPP